MLALHDAGYLHGDLHGNNIIILDDYEVKLIDFGQSDLVDSVSASDEFTPGVYSDYLYLKFYIARLIFPGLEVSSIAGIIKTIRDFTAQ